jgi:4-hydroxythreonine-4-phosphate dehydrogenase
MGDPAGIGPEIIVKALECPAVFGYCRPLIVGDADVIKAAREIVGSRAKLNPITSIPKGMFRQGILDVFDLNNISAGQYQHGKLSPDAGNAAFEAICKAIALAMEGKIDGTVTAPIHKESLNQAGHHFAGHTEIYAYYTDTKEVAMLLVENDLRIAHVSTHVSLRKACNLVKRDRVLTVIRLLDGACRQLGIPKPHIGVAGLNPHASDGGLFGQEEKDEIIPAVKKAKSQRIDAEGPIAPDTLYPKAKGGFYDAVVAMYHDQGHIAFKMEGFVWDKKTRNWKTISGVNITLGLPIVRTSVDHGTAFDIAGRGVADHQSLVNAIQYASLLAGKKENTWS